MIENKQVAQNTQSRPGDRLAAILDYVHFGANHGRIVELMEYLKTAAPDEFGTLKYTTVRSWLSASSPPMDKMATILRTLAIEYPFPEGTDFNQLVSWWKVGAGVSPLRSLTVGNEPASSTTRKPGKAGSPPSMAFYDTLTPLDQGQCFLLLASVGEDIAFDPFKSLSTDAFYAVLENVSEAKIRCNFDFESDELREVAQSFLSLAKNNVLQR